MSNLKFIQTFCSKKSHSIRRVATQKKLEMLASDKAIYCSKISLKKTQVLCFFKQVYQALFISI